MTTTKRSATRPTTQPAAVLGTRALNRATLERQLLLRRSPMSARDAVAHLLGLQAQNVKPPYYALTARLDGFDEAVDDVFDRHLRGRPAVDRHPLLTPWTRRPYRLFV